MCFICSDFFSLDFTAFLLFAFFNLDFRFGISFCTCWISASLGRIYTKSGGAVKLYRLVRLCGSVTPWSVCVTCWEPQLISLPKTRLLCFCATSMLDLQVIVCPHRWIKNNSKQPEDEAGHYCVF